MAADPEPGGAEHPYGPCRDQTRRQRLGLGEEIGGGGSFFAEMKFEPQSGREVEVGGTALSTWLLLLFSTQLKGECSLIWTRGEEKRSGTGICQEGAGKQRARRRGERGQRRAQGGAGSPAARRGRSRAATRSYCSWRAGGHPRPPQTRRLRHAAGGAGADAGRLEGRRERFFSGGFVAWPGPLGAGRTRGARGCRRGKQEGEDCR